MRILYSFRAQMTLCRSIIALLGAGLLSGCDSSDDDGTLQSSDGGPGADTSLEASDSSTDTSQKASDSSTDTSQEASDGASNDTSLNPDISSADGSTPHTGTPIALPGTFEAEDFDNGGEGVAYHDTGTANIGGQYRADEGVDIIASVDPAGGNYVVDNFVAGEWMLYTVDVTTAVLPHALVDGHQRALFDGHPGRG